MTAERVHLGDRMRWLAATLLGAGLLCSAPRAQASDLALAWSAPAGCPDVSELQASLRTRLDRPLRFGLDAPTALSAQIERAGAGFRLTLNTRTESGQEQRNLEARSCNELARATLLVAALLLSTHPLPPPESVSPAPAQRSAATRGPLRLTLSGVLDLGRLPAPAPGFGARLGIDVGRLRFSAGGLYLPERARPVASQPGAEVAVQLTAAQLDVCYALIVSPALGACVTGEAGVLSAKGRGLREDQRASSFWLLGGLGMALWAPLTSWLDLAAELTLGLPATRAQLSVHDLGSIYRVPVLTGQLQVGLSARFP
jgi:hypothetical protein